jgi:hypothetical protein
MTSCHSIYLHLGQITRRPTAVLRRYGLVYTQVAACWRPLLPLCFYEAGCSISEALASSCSASGLY